MYPVSYTHLFHHLGSQTFHQNKRMREASVNKRKPGKAVNNGVAQTNCFSSIFGNTFYFLSLIHI